MQHFETGDLADAPHRNATTRTIAGGYLLDGGGVSIGDSTTSIETAVEASVFRFGNDIVTAGQQTLTHPDGDPDDPRIDLIYVNSSGTADRKVGQPMPADPPDRIAPRTRTPAPPVLASGTQEAAVLAWLWVPAGTGSSSEMYNDWVIDRRMPGTGLNDLDLIPGRDLQYRIDQAREGETLRGDRSQEITLDQPLTVTTPDHTIEDVTLRYADGAAAASDDAMITADAPGVTVQNTTLRGNKSGQTTDPDGIRITDSRATVSNVRTAQMAGVAVNVDGTNTSLRDTTIETLNTFNGAKTAILLDGDGVSATEIDYAFSRNADVGGTVLLRNGPSGTRMRTIKGQDQQYGVRLADSGASADATAPITNTTIDDLSVSRCEQAVRGNDTSQGVGHRDLTIRGVSVTGMDPEPAQDEHLVAISRFDDVTIEDSRLVGNYDVWCISLSAVEGARVENCTVGNNSSEFGGIFAYNSDDVTLDGCSALRNPNVAYKFTVGADTSKKMRIANCDAGSSQTAGILYEENSPGTFDRAIVAQNAVSSGTGAIDTSQITGSKYVEGNV